MASRIAFLVSVMVIAIMITVHSQATPLPAPVQAVSNRTYVGSGTCGDCHFAIYERWAKSRMANVVTDPRVRPQVVIPDFSKPDPLLTFKLDDVALVYGTKWKQRYLKKVGNDYFPL